VVPFVFLLDICLLTFAMCIDVIVCICICLVSICDTCYKDLCVVVVIVFCDL